MLALVSDGALNAAGEVMIVCSCNVLSEADVRRVADAAGSRAWAVHRCLGCRPRCGTCLPTIAALLQGWAPPDPALCAGCPHGPEQTHPTMHEPEPLYELLAAE